MTWLIWTASYLAFAYILFCPKIIILYVKDLWKYWLSTIIISWVPLYYIGASLVSARCCIVLRCHNSGAVIGNVIHYILLIKLGPVVQN